jgi:hypothetical protein
MHPCNSLYSATGRPLIGIMWVIVVKLIMG